MPIYGTFSNTTDLIVGSITAETSGIVTNPIYGSDDASGDLELYSTTNATKGKIFFGATSALDEENNRLGIGTVDPLSRLHIYSGDIKVTAGMYSYYDIFDTHIFSLQRGGNSTNGLKVVSLDDVDFYTNAATTSGGNLALRITASQLIGIGNSNPQNILHLGGNSSDVYRGIRFSPVTAIGEYWNTIIGLSSSSGTTGLALEGAGDAAGVYTPSRIELSDSGIALRTGPGGNETPTSNRLYINISGNVGIGNTNPTSLLYVGSATGAQTTPTAIHMDGSYCNPLNVDKLKFYLYEGSGDKYGFGIGPAWDLYYVAGDATHGIHRFFTSNTERLTIVANGNTGIGISDPESSLEIRKDVSGGMGADLCISNKVDVTGTAVAIDFGVDNSTCANGQGNAQIKVVNENGANQASYMSFSTWNGSAFGERMRIAPVGNIGIGTQSPEQTLNIVNASFVQGRFESSVSGYSGGIELWGRGSSAIDQKWEIQSTPQNGNPAGCLLFYDRTDSRYSMVIDNSGQVGIGTFSPSSLLHVGGNNSGPTPASTPTAITLDKTYYSSAADRSKLKVYLYNDGISYFGIGLGNESDLYYTACDGNNYGKHKFLTGTSNTPKVIFNNDGTVGIGTTSPDQLLTVNSSATNANSLVSYKQNGTTYAYTGMGTDNRLHIEAISTDLYIQADANKDITLSTNGVERVRVLGSGYVGIGKSNPAYLLTVSGQVCNAGVDGDDAGFLGYASASTHIFSLTRETNSAKLSSYDGIEFWGGATTLGGGTKHVTITSDGKVGIGLTPSAEKLEVNGTVKASVFLTSSANAATSGVLRLANTQEIGWRNAANSGNLLVSYDAYNHLTIPTGLKAGTTNITSLGKTLIAFNAYKDGSTYRYGTTGEYGHFTEYNYVNGNLEFKSSTTTGTANEAFASIDTNAVIFGRSYMSIGYNANPNVLLVASPTSDPVAKGAGTFTGPTTTVTITGSQFTSEIGIGDRVYANGLAGTVAVVTSVDSDTQITVNTAIGDGTGRTLRIKKALLGLRKADTNLAMIVTDTGNVGIGTDIPTAVLDINSDKFRLRTAKTPATAGAAGTTGDICWDSDYIYVCVATNTWKRTAISTWT